MTVVVGIPVDQTRMHKVFHPTHRCMSLLWHVCLDLVPLDVAGCGVFLYMVVHETTDVRESIDTLSAKLAMTKKSMLMPRPKGAVTYVENTFHFFSSKELLFGFVFLTLLSFLVGVILQCSLDNGICKAQEIVGRNNEHDVVAGLDDFI